MRLKDSEKELILRAWIKSRNKSMTALAKSVGYGHKTFIRVVRRYQAYLNRCQSDPDLIEIRVNG